MINELWYTVGPSSLGKEEALLAEGATGARFTFSFGTPELQHERAADLKAAASKQQVTGHTIADLAGGKIRLGTFDGVSSIDVKAGDAFEMVLATSTDPMKSSELPVPDAAFFAMAAQNDFVTVGDGAAVLIIDRVNGQRLRVVASDDGTINQTRGLTIQGNAFRPACLTNKDMGELSSIVASNLYDIVMLSFVSSADDVYIAKKMIRDAGKQIQVAAKIETALGVENLDDITKEADCLVAARGDLALALPWVDLPAAVHAIAEASLRKSKPWIVATQIAEGLERFAFPTRAEIGDCAHWLNDENAAGCLLSYETVFGPHPIAAVRSVRKMINRWGRR